MVINYNKAAKLNNSSKLIALTVEYFENLVFWGMNPCVAIHQTIS